MHKRLKSRYSEWLGGHWLVASLFLFLASSPLVAVDPHTLISQYAHSTWTIRDGSLPAVPFIITQTTDGYLWIGTNAGLVRFDGANFALWGESEGRELSTNQINGLFGAKDGSLWISDIHGTLKSFVRRWSNRKLVTENIGNSQSSQFVEAEDGSLWYLRNEPPGEGPSSLCRIATNKTKCFGKEDGLDFGLANTFLLDHEGFAWVAALNRLIRWKPGSSQVYQPAGLKGDSGIEVTSLVSAPDGSLYAGFGLAGAGMGVQHLVQGVWKPIQIGPFNSSSLKAIYLLIDRHDALWIGTLDEGLYRVYGNQVEHFTTENGLTGDYIQCLYEDAEGTLWVATNNGVDNFRDIPVTSFSSRNGLCTVEADSVLAARDGTVWVGGAEGLCALHDGHFKSILPSNGLPGHQVTSMFEDHARQLWLGVDEGLYIYEKGKFTPILMRNGTKLGFVVGLTEDTSHNIWVETVRPVRALWRIRDRQVQEEFPPSEVPSGHSITADPRSGIWIGLFTGDLARWRDRHLETLRYEHPEGGWVRSLLVDADGTVYGATPFGVIGWRDGKQGILSERNGLQCDEIHSVVTDREGSLWLYSKCGLVRVPHAEMQRWWAQPDTVVRTQVFGAVDGALTNYAPFESSQETPDGRLWFVNASELQTIDPEHLATNPVQPPVHIENVVADSVQHSVDESLRLPAHTHDLEIDYAALSFLLPQRVRFKYKLDERDVNWQDAGTRRQAFYTDLPPGNYRFRVIACNNSGLWNTDGATLQFTIAPAWYQTKWFDLLCGLLLLLTVWAIYSLRVRHVAAEMRLRFSERLAERTRMARELHDTFLQTVQGSKMVADDALDPSADEARMRKALEKLSRWLGQAVDEGRAALHALRVSITEKNHLSEALRRATEDHQLPSSMTVAFSVIGDARDVHPIVRDEIYRIGYEAIRNSAVHSRGSRLEIELRYASDLTLRIKDNGLGIDPSNSDPANEGHFGLQGMRERATRIRGKLSIVSSTNAGTEVTLVVPGVVVYRNEHPSFAQRFKGALKRLIKSSPTDRF